MKKRILALALMVCLILTMCLTGCGANNAYEKLDLSEYVKVGEYTGLSRDDIKVSVSKEEVKEQVKADVKETAETEEVKSGKVKEGDTVNIDYVGKKDGEVFDGGTGSGYDLEIGSNTFIDGFEDGLIGKKVGTTCDLNLTFPEDYNTASLAGEDVVFTVTINSIKREVVPEYNDEWVQANSNVKTTAEYEAQVKENLLDEKEQDAKNDIVSSLWKEVIENSEVIKYPEEEVNAYVTELEKQWDTMASSYGVEKEDVWGTYGLEDEAAYNEYNKGIAEDYVKEQMVLYYIADKEGLTYTDEEADELRTAIKEAGYTDDETFKESYGQAIEPYIDYQLTLQKVGDFIFDNAVVKKESKKDDSSKEKETTTDDGADDATSNDEEGGADA